MKKTIIDAYIEQKKNLVIVLSGLPDANITNNGKYLSEDLKINVLNTNDYLVNESLSSIDDFNKNELIKKINKLKKKGLIIVSNIFPSNFLKTRVDLHINIKIKKKLEMSEFENFYYKNLKNSYVNKFIKYNQDNEELYDKIFDFIIEFITNKLDDGNYTDSISDLNEKSPFVHKKQQGKDSYSDTSSIESLNTTETNTSVVDLSSNTKTKSTTDVNESSTETTDKKDTIESNTDTTESNTETTDKNNTADSTTNINIETNDTTESNEENTKSNNNEESLNLDGGFYYGKRILKRGKKPKNIITGTRILKRKINFH